MLNIDKPMAETEIYNNVFVGYRITETPSPLGGTDVNFYYAKDKEQTLRFQIWARDLAEIMGVLTSVVRRSDDLEESHNQGLNNA